MDTLAREGSQEKEVLRAHKEKADRLAPRVLLDRMDRGDLLENQVYKENLEPKDLLVLRVKEALRVHQARKVNWENLGRPVKMAQLVGQVDREREVQVGLRVVQVLRPRKVYPVTLVSGVRTVHQALQVQ